jgi:hypothetical protein
VWTSRRRRRRSIGFGVDNDAHEGEGVAGWDTNALRVLADARSENGAGVWFRLRRVSSA